MTTTHQPGAVAVFFKDNAVFLTGAVAVIIAFATMQSDVEKLKENVGENKIEITENKKQITGRVEPLRKEVQAIRTEQAVMKQKLDNMDVRQKERHEDTKDALARILEKVDN